MGGGCFLNQGYLEIALVGKSSVGGVPHKAIKSYNFAVDFFIYIIQVTLI